MTIALGTCLAVTCHDPVGLFAPGIRGVADSIGDVFAAVAVNATTQTHSQTISALRELDVPVQVSEHGAGSVGIGTARRDAVDLGLRTDLDRVLYSDLDHIVRWLSVRRDEVEALLAPRNSDMSIVGRSPESMAQEPERLQLTEELVNRVYAVANGLEERWDLMIAVRLMNRAAARIVVEHGHETTISTDVTWPMLVAAQGGSVEYVDAAGLCFREREDFGQDADLRDGDPQEWHRRMVTATAYVAAIVDTAGFRRDSS